MTSNTTRYLQRGVVIGLALLFCAQGGAQHGSQFLRDTLRRELRGQSYTLIEREDTYEIIILGDGKAPAGTVRITPADRVERLYELVDEGDPYAASALVVALDDPSSDVRLAAVRLLGETDSVEARSALELLLRHPDAEIRLDVVEAIADTPGATELLRLASENDVVAVASTAREYLRELDSL